MAHEQIKEAKLNAIAWREKEKVNKKQDANLLFDGGTDLKNGRGIRTSECEHD